MHMIYTGSGNMPYVQCGSVGDFIPEPRCLKSVVGLQTRERDGVSGRSGRKGRDRQELCYGRSVLACA